MYASLKSRTQKDWQAKASAPPRQVQGFQPDRPRLLRFASDSCGTCRAGLRGTGVLCIL